MKKKELKYYKSIEILSIGLLEKTLQTDNLNYLIKGIDFDDVQDLPPQKAQGSEILQNLWYQIPYLDQSDILEESEIAYYELRFLATKDYNHLNRANELKHYRKIKLENQQKEFSKNIDFSYIYAAISKEYGTIIDPFKYSVKQFFVDKHLLNERIRKNNQKRESSSKFD